MKFPLMFVSGLYVKYSVWLTREGFISWLVFFTKHNIATMSLHSVDLFLFGLISHFHLSTNNFLFDMEWALS